jgi:hypothetical protein
VPEDKAAKKEGKRAKAEAEVREKIAEMRPPFGGMGERLHELISETAPELEPRLFYGMPAYARAGKVVCFFRAPWANEKHDYMTFGLTENATLTVDAGVSDQLIASAWYFTGVDDATEARLVEIVKGAAI